MKRLNKKGFTLIELVVVIAILGILAALMIPRVAGFRENANKAADEAAASTISKAILMYNASHDEKLDEGDLAGYDTELSSMCDNDYETKSTEYGPGETLEFTYTAEEPIIVTATGSVQVWPRPEAASPSPTP